VTSSTAVISFFVSVPVLSEHTVDTEPSVSTAGSLRTMAFLEAMLLTPSAMVMVTTAGRPSGMMATAMATDARKASAQSVLE